MQDSSGVPKSWGAFLPINCTHAFGDHQQQTANLHTEKTLLQQALCSGESFIFRMQQFYETKLSTITLIQNFRRSFQLSGPTS